MGHNRSFRSKMRKFTGNRFTNAAANSESKVDDGTPTASEIKLKNNKHILPETDADDFQGNRIFDIRILITVFAALCCLICYEKELVLVEDSKFGLASDWCVKCKSCEFFKAFSSSEKYKQTYNISSLFVLGLRLIGKGISAGKKNCATLIMPILSPPAFCAQEKKIQSGASSVAH